jgi:hypothetical protein
MKRHPALVRLSQEHHHGLVMCMRIERETRLADPDVIRRLYSDLIAFWAAGLLPHFRAENECLLARLVRRVDLDDERIRRTQRDHLGIEALVAEMRDTQDPGLRKEALIRFAQRLREHIRWEEEVLFETTQTTLKAPEMRFLQAHLEQSLPKETVSPWPSANRG